MSLTVEQLLVDAKKLTNRLKDDESKADNLITQVKNTNNHVEAMKQYTDDVDKLNEAASQRPHSVLVAGLKRESQHIRELRAENRELRIALAEYQNTVKLIMSKYRQQISHLVKASQVNVSSLHNSHCSQYSQVILDQCAKMEKMRKVMTDALNVVEDNTSERELKVEELISRLTTENRGLREIIDIYTKYGCQQPTIEPAEDSEKKAAPVGVEASKEVGDDAKETKKEMVGDGEEGLKASPEIGASGENQ